MKFKVYTGETINSTHETEMFHSATKNLKQHI